MQEALSKRQPVFADCAPSLWLSPIISSSTPREDRGPSGAYQQWDVIMPM